MEKIEEKLKNILDVKVLKKGLLALGVLVGVVLIFTFGVAVGVQKASFGRAWGNHYYENFGMPSGNVMGMWDVDDFPNAHGAVGKVIKLELPNIIVQDSKDNIEKIIAITDDTRMQKGMNAIMSSDLKIDDFVVIIGVPNNQGVIDSKLIRVVPNPESLPVQ